MPKADPIFAMIKWHRAAMKEYLEGRGEYPDLDILLNTTPATEAGRGALIEYAASGEPGLEDQPAMVLNVVAKSFGVTPIFVS